MKSKHRAGGAVGIVTVCLLAAGCSPTQRKVAAYGTGAVGALGLMAGAGTMIGSCVTTESGADFKPGCRQPALSIGAATLGASAGFLGTAMLLFLAFDDKPSSKSDPPPAPRAETVEREPVFSPPPP